jgi:hypothetical protein
LRSNNSLICLDDSLSLLLKNASLWPIDPVRTFDQRCADSIFEPFDRCG